MSSTFKSKIVIRSALFFASIIVSIFCMEIGLRFWELTLPQVDRALIHQPDDELGWVHAPNLSYSSGNPNIFKREFVVEVEINSVGLMGPEREPNFDSRVLRILLLGNSFAEAIQVDLEHSAAKILENELAANLPDGFDTIQVFNAGVSNYSTGQNLLSYKTKWGRYRPHVVFVYVAPFIMVRNAMYEFTVYGKHDTLSIRPMFTLVNDSLIIHKPLEMTRYRKEFAAVKEAEYFGNTSKRVAQGAGFPTLSAQSSRIDKIFAGSYFWNFLAPYKGGWFERLGLRKYQPENFKVDSKLIDLTLKILQELDSLVRSNATPGELVVVNIAGDQAWSQWNPTFDSGVQQIGLPLIKSYQALQKREKNGARVVWKHDFHWNERGHKIVGEEMAAWVKERY